MNIKLQSAIPFLCMAPSILLGVFVMVQNNIASKLWMQNLVIFLIASITSYITIYRKSLPKIHSSFTIIISFILLCLTIIDAGSEDVHRWLTIGPIRLYIGSIVLPLLLIELGKITALKRRWFTTLLVSIIILLLTLQPDASKTTSFTIASIFLLYKFVGKPFRYLVFTIFLLAPMYTWYYIDKLPAVSYVEDILLMAREIGTVWFVLGIISLMLLPMPFFFFNTIFNRRISISLGIYFSLVIISTVFGNFPVPLMGFGISPIIGYAFAITWLMRNFSVSKK